MTEAQEIVISQMLSLLTDEQRQVMIDSILAKSGRDKRDRGHSQDAIEDDAIDMIRFCSVET